MEKSNSEKFIEIVKEKGFAEVTDSYTTTSHTVWKDSAGNQVLFHLGYEHDENDMHDIKLLCERLNIPVPSKYK